MSTFDEIIQKDYNKIWLKSRFERAMKIKNECNIVTGK